MLHFPVSLSISMVNHYSLFLLIAMNEKVSLPTYCRCLTCVWRSLNKGSPAHSTCMWALPCWSGSIHGNISPLAQLKSTQDLITEEETSSAALWTWHLTSRCLTLPAPLWCEKHHGGHEDAPQLMSLDRTLFSRGFIVVSSHQRCSRALMRVMNINSGYYI